MKKYKKLEEDNTEYERKIKEQWETYCRLKYSYQLMRIEIKRIN